MQFTRRDLIGFASIGTVSITGCLGLGEDQDSATTEPASEDQQNPTATTESGSLEEATFTYKTTKPSTIESASYDIEEKTISTTLTITVQGEFTALIDIGVKKNGERVNMPTLITPEEVEGGKAVREITLTDPESGEYTVVYESQSETIREDTITITIE